MLRVLAQLTFLSVCASALGCELIMRDLPPRADLDATSPPDTQDAGEVLHVDAGAHGDLSPGHDGSDGSMPDAPHDAAVEGVDADLPHPDPDGCDGGSEKVFFHDEDQDQHGDPSMAMTGCVPPSNGDWVELGDDCNDDQPDVHPGQTKFFGEGYEREGSAVLSFDYDCKNGEVSGPDQVQAPPSCSGLLTCAGSGYAPNDERKGIVGINAYCGSTVISTCKAAGLMCQPSPSTTEQPYVCH
jgi:hypothetical protein